MDYKFKSTALFGTTPKGAKDTPEVHNQRFNVNVPIDSIGLNDLGLYEECRICLMNMPLACIPSFGGTTRAENQLK